MTTNNVMTNQRLRGGTVQGDLDLRQRAVSTSSRTSFVASSPGRAQEVARPMTEEAARAASSSSFLMVALLPG